MKRRVKFLDTTLRDGEQTPGVTLTAEEKLLIANKLDSIGVDVIEAGSAITSKGEREALRLIAKENLSAEVCSYCRILVEDIDAALSCDVDSIHLVAPVSNLHIEKKLKKDKEWVREQSIHCVEYAKEHGLIVEYSGEDASRADLDYLSSLFSDAINAGADRLCFCDTVGVLVPEKTDAIFKQLSKIGPVSVHCHDDFGLATCNSIRAVLSGASQVHATVNGIGERAGNAPLEEVVMALVGLEDMDVSIETKELYSLSRLVSRLTGIAVAPNKSIVGSNAFTHEAGIHVHGLLADTSTYEPMLPQLVGRERKIVIGKHAGRASVRMALDELNIKATDKQIDEIFSRVKDLGDRGKHLTDADVEAIAEAVLNITKEPKVKLLELTVVSGTITPTASIKLQVNGDIQLSSGTGNGPVDAAINALKNALRTIADVELEEYHVDAITGGTNALVEVVVTLRRGDNVITARGAHSDIIMASVEAVLQGINRLLERED